MGAGTQGRGTIHVDVPLTNVAVEYRNDSFISDKVLPVVSVPKQSDKYFVFDKGNMRLDTTARADKSPSNQVVAYTASTDSFFCNKQALHDLVSDDERANADSVISPDIRVTKRLQDRLLLRREYDAATYLFNATTFAGYTATAAALSGGTGYAWSDLTNSDPQADVLVMKSTIKKVSGFMPNTLTLGVEVFNKLLTHPDVKDSFKYTSGGVIGVEQLRQYFQIEKLLIGEASYNTAAEGATESMSYLWGKYALLAYVPNAPEKDTPALGYNFSWKLHNALTGTVKKWREESLGSDKIEVEMAYDFKITAASAGYLLSAVVA